MKILIADDNHDAADSTAMVLQAAGHEVATVYDGADAVVKAEAFRPDVVMLDIGMPKLNGYDTATKIRQQPWASRAILIALSGWGQPEIRQRSEDAGFDRHLIKPVSHDTLENIIQQHFRERSDRGDPSS